MSGDELQDLHDTYVRITGLDVKFSIHYWTWENFSKFFTKEDLVLVLNWIKRKNKQAEHKYRRSLAITKLIGDEEKFDELRAQAAAEERNRRKPLTPKQRVMEQWRPTVVEDDTTRKDNTKRAAEALREAIKTEFPDSDKGGSVQAEPGGCG